MNCLNDDYETIIPLRNSNGTNYNANNAATVKAQQVAVKM